MKTYVAVTDQRWYEFLRDRPHLTEANFWMPSGGPANFGAVQPGEAFLFKTHRPHNRLVGGGFLADYRRLRLSVAWQELGEANGVGSEDEMRSAIARYRREPLMPHEDPVIGCAMLRDTVFFTSTELSPSASEFPGNLVRGKTFELGAHSGSVVEDAFWRLLADAPGGMSAADLSYFEDGPTRGSPQMYVPRLGQRSFAAVIQTAYGQRCAVTGTKILPALQAAHIVPVAQHGQHRIDNGLLLRADVHILFDQGYLGVHPESRTLQVSGRLREDFGNGAEFYERAGSAVAVPTRPVDRPNRSFLEWHLDVVYQH